MNYLQDYHYLVYKNFYIKKSGCKQTLLESIKVNAFLFVLRVFFYLNAIKNIFSFKNETNFEQIIDDTLQQQLEEFGFKYTVDE